MLLLLGTWVQSLVRELISRLLCGEARNQKRKGVHKDYQVSEVSCSWRHLSEVHLPVLSGTSSSILSSHLGVSSSSLWIIFGTHFSLAKGRERWSETEARESLRKEAGQRTSSNSSWSPSLWCCRPTHSWLWVRRRQGGS